MDYEYVNEERGGENILKNFELNSSFDIWALGLYGWYLELFDVPY